MLNRTIILLLAAAFMVSGCGLKGDLYLEEPSQNDAAPATDTNAAGEPEGAQESVEAPAEP